MKRNELYAAVWSRPMFHVARQLGVGERALAAACKRSDIPTPPRGYWRQVTTGQSPTRAELQGDGEQAVTIPQSLAPTVLVSADDRKRSGRSHDPWPFSRVASPQPSDEAADHQADIHRGEKRLPVSPFDLGLVRSFARKLRDHEDLGELVEAVAVRATQLAPHETFAMLAWVEKARTELERCHPASALLRLLLTPQIDEERSGFGSGAE